MPYSGLKLEPPCKRRKLSQPSLAMSQDGSGAESENIQHRQQRLFEVALQCWKSGLYTDVTFVVDQEKFPAHRLVMVALSDYFSALFKNSGKEFSDITLQNISPEDFAVILKFAYTGQVDVTNDNVQSVLIAADYYRVDAIKKECSTFMAASLDVENVCDVLMFAIKYSLPSLEQQSLTFLKHNLESIFKTEGFFQILDPLYLAQILEDDNLVLYNNNVLLKSADRELLVLNTVLQFLTARRIEDPSVVQRLIRAVRFPLIQEDALKSCLDNFENVENFNIVHKDLRLRAAVEAERVSAEVPASWSQPRKFTTPEMISRERPKRYACGGQIQRSPEPPGYLVEDLNLEIHRIDLWIRLWDGRPVIGGLRIRYRDPNSGHLHPTVYEKGDCQQSIEHHHFELQRNEFIQKVVIGSGYLIDRLGFETNLGREYGPFGGPGGSEYREIASEFQFSYLFDINCDSTLTQGAQAIFNLMLRWVIFKKWPR